VLHEESPPPLREEGEVKGPKLVNTQATLIFIRAYKLSIYQTKPSMYDFCAFSKEGSTNMVNVMYHPLWKFVKGHKVERQVGQDGIHKNEPTSSR